MIYLLQVCAGALLSLAFAPFQQTWLGLPALTVLCYCWLQPKRQAPVRYGLCFGLGYFAGGVSWVYISLYYYGNAPLPFAIAANAVLIVMLALYPAAVGYLLRRLSAPATLQRALLIPLLWTLGELARAFILGGFPWLAVGYSALHTPADGLAPLAGVFALSFLLLLLAALLAFSVIQRSLKGALTAAALYAVAWLSGLWSFTVPEGKPFTVALIQGNVAQLTKFDPQQMQQSLEDYLRLAMQQQASVIILPETAFPFMEEMLPPDLLPQIRQIFQARGQTLVTGILTGNSAGQQYYNSVLALGDGTGRYSKHHLLPFGEYIPLRRFLRLFEKYVDIPYSNLQAGAPKQQPFHTHGYIAGVSVCYEAAFGRDIRRAMPEAQYLINISNDGWFKDSIAAAQHLQMNQMRARELGREMARATNDGITVILDARGNIKKQLPRFERAVLTGDIQPYAGLTPYARYGNSILSLFLLIYALLTGLLCRYRLHQSR